MAFHANTKTVQELPDPSLRMLVMQYIQRCRNGRDLGLRLASILHINYHKQYGHGGTIIYSQYLAIVPEGQLAKIV